MFEIRTVQAESIKKVLTPEYRLDESTTMGRLIKHLLDKGHYGKRQEAIAGHIVEKYFDSDELVSNILAQLSTIYSWGHRPIKILIGREEIEELHDLNHPTNGILRQEFGFQRRGTSFRIMNLPFTVVPQMKGVIVLDDEMVSVNNQ